MEGRHFIEQNKKQTGENTMRAKRYKTGALLLACSLLMACGSTEFDDYATNEGYISGGSAAGQAAEDAEQTQSEEETENVKESADETEEAGIAADKVKVGVVHLTSPEDGSGYTYTHDLGIQGMQQNLGLSDSQIIRKLNVSDSDEAMIEQAIQECIDEGCNIIFATSWGYMETTARMAEEYPDICFSHGTGYLSNGKNFNNYFGRIYQARYLSGIVAGMKTTTGKIGYVAAMDSSNSEVTGGIDAFALGVYSVNPDAQIFVKVTNSWFDPAAEEAAATQLLDMGCDVLTQHCDTAYAQSLAQERGVYSIGYNSDMSKEAPEACLCSVIWNWSAYYTSAVQSIIDGTWDGSNYYGGMAENLVGITELADFCAEGTAEKVAEAEAKIMSGEFGVFDGVIETNTGETVGEEGKTLDDETITSGINWYFKTVTVVE